MSDFANRVQEIKVELFQILVSYKMVFIHRAKTACLCGELQAVHKGIANQINPNHGSVTPGEDEIFRDVLSLIQKLKGIYQELSESQYISTVINKAPSYIRESLNSFRITFNKQLISLQLMKNEPCPINEVQMKIDDMADIQDLIVRLQTICESSSSISDDKKDMMKHLLGDYTDISNQMKAEEEKNLQKQNEKRRVMTTEEVNKNLADFKKYCVKIDDYQMQKRIGSGGFAEVYLGYHKESGKVVAIKKLHAQSFNAQTFEMFRREVEIAASMQHFAILSFHGVSLEPPFCILTDFMSGGCLFNRLHKGPMLDPTKLTITALGVACGMQYIHDKKMLHRDIKSLNILLDADDFPKICDFGMSRALPDDQSLMTGGAGTSQWMAPEVIGSTPYTQKADVYSFGILLWELLTKDVPFRGLKDVQVAMAVLNQDRRPLIPQSCPPKLSKMIKICWDRDPDKRPDFKTIAKAFQSGGISFPGTNDDKVKAYIDQFMEHEHQVEKFDPKAASKESAKSITTGLQQDSAKVDQALSKLKQIVDISPWVDFILAAEMIEAFLEVIRNCNETQLAFNIILALDPMLKNSKLVRCFVKAKGSESVLDLFIKFGTTSMNKIIEIFSTLIQNDTLKFSVEHFAKLAPFLVSSDLNVRKMTTDLILIIIDRNEFDDESSLNVIASNVLANSIPEAMPSLLENTLILLKKLLALPQPFNTIIRSDGPSVALALTNHKGAEFRVQALQIMNMMLTKSIPQTQTVSLVISSFYSLLSHNADNADLILEALISVGTLLKASCCYKEAANHPEIAKAFRICFSCVAKQEAVLYSLKLCYSFLNNQISYKTFTALTPDIIEILSSSKFKNEVLEIATYCLTMIIYKEGNFTITDENQIEILRQFLHDHLRTESPLKSPVLRLSGVLSSSIGGVNLLRVAHAPKKIAQIIGFSGEQDKEIIKLAIMAIATHSGTMPTSKSAISCIPTFFANINNQYFAPYPMIAIVNLTMNPLAADVYVKYLPTLVDLLASDDPGTANRAFIAIHRIMKMPEACEKIADAKTLQKLIQNIEKFLDGQFETSSYDIIEAIASLPKEVGKIVIKNSHSISGIVEKFREQKISDPLRPLLTRIITRIGIDV